MLRYFRQADIPVSYTHLDVYKRQGIQIIAGQQNRVVDRCAELDTADDDESEEHRTLSINIRYSGVDEHSAFDRNQYDNWKQ